METHWTVRSCRWYFYRRSGRHALEIRRHGPQQRRHRDQANPPQKGHRQRPLDRLRQIRPRPRPHQTRQDGREGPHGRALRRLPPRRLRRPRRGLPRHVRRHAQEALHVLRGQFLGEHRHQQQAPRLPTVSTRGRRRGGRGVRTAGRGGDAVARPGRGVAVRAAGEQSERDRDAVHGERCGRGGDRSARGREVLRSAGCRCRSDGQGGVDERGGAAESHHADRERQEDERIDHRRVRREQGHVLDAEGTVLDRALRCLLEDEGGQVRLQDQVR
mmetsp:Transcript_33690/g.70825  ORF Transcript_33690/g.70825 Transcript_33690/m.70825 type:complete len:273 (-) Transcript_33690:1309-2127(-)